MKLVSEAWTPWRHRISEQAELLFQENRKPRSDHQLLQRLLNKLFWTFRRRTKNNGPVEPVLMRFQTLMANSLAMLQLVHLIVEKFHHKFNELALAAPVDSSLRAPNLQEVLAAKAVWTAVTSAMRGYGWFLDTMSEIAHCRQDVQTALQPRPRFAQNVSCLAVERTLSGQRLKRGLKQPASSLRGRPQRRHLSHCPIISGHWLS